MNKPQLIRLIHIAKSQLKLDDETYRSKLEALTGKTSCSKMTTNELDKVYQSFKQAGFKRKLNKKTARVSPDSTGQSRSAEIPKIRAIWIKMFEQGFITSPDESALNAYVMRMTKRRNGVGVAEVGWLDGFYANRVLEALKQWHLRLMTEKLTARRVVLPEHRTGDVNKNYGAIAAIYERIRNQDAYAQRCAAKGNPMKETVFSCCGYRCKTPIPTNLTEKWDSPVSCPVCMTRFYRTVTATRIYMRART